MRSPTNLSPFKWHLIFW